MKFTKMHGIGNDFIIVEADEAAKKRYDKFRASGKKCATGILALGRTV